MSANDSFQIAVLAGDGIGPEVMAPAMQILEAAARLHPDLRLRFSEAPAGAGHYRDTGASLPDTTTAARAGGCHPARRLRPAPYPLPRQHGDHAASGAALHFRSLRRMRPCRLIANIPSPIVGAPSAGGSRRHPGIDRGPTCPMGKGVTETEAGEICDHPEDWSVCSIFLPLGAARKRGGRGP
jgi:3-isopropylmalate dehydrogenase